MFSTYEKLQTLSFSTNFKKKLKNELLIWTLQLFYNIKFYANYPDTISDYFDINIMYIRSKKKK